MEPAGPAEEAAPATPAAVVPPTVRDQVVAALLRRVEAGDLAAADVVLRHSALPRPPRSEPKVKAAAKGRSPAEKRTRVRQRLRVAARAELEASGGTGIDKGALVAKFEHSGVSRASLYRAIADMPALKLGGIESQSQSHPNPAGAGLSR